jgi:hypothetical protein
MVRPSSNHVRDEKFVQNFSWELERNSPFVRRRRRRWEDNVKSDLKYTLYCVLCVRMRIGFSELRIASSGRLILKMIINLV